MTLKNISQQSGILPVHKPVGPTSRRVVDEVEQRLDDCKIGHAGTLDPMAEGLLPLHVNEATKLVPYLQAQPKTYHVRMRFDYRSASYDLGEEIESVPASQRPQRNHLQEVLQQYVGTIQQRPPKYSAVRSDGDRLHELTRDSKDPTPEARPVTCHEITLLDFDFPSVTLEVSCGKGFYVRSLVRDLSAELNQEGGITTALVRTQYGPFSLGNACLLHEPGNWPTDFHPPRFAVREYPWIHCDSSEIDHLTNGGWIDRHETENPTAMALGPDQRLHAILEATDERGHNQWRPRRVLNRSDHPATT